MTHLQTEHYSNPLFGTHSLMAIWERVVDDDSSTTRVAWQIHRNNSMFHGTNWLITTKCAITLTTDRTHRLELQNWIKQIVSGYEEYQF